MGVQGPRPHRRLPGAAGLLAAGGLAASLCWWAPVPAQEAPRALSPGMRAKLDGLLESVNEAEAELKIAKNRSKLIRTRHDITRAAIADPGTVELVAFGTREVELIAKETGSTTVTLWMADADQVHVLTFLVTVTVDRGIEDRRRLEYGEFEAMLNEMFPESRIQLMPIADKLIVRGQARDAEEATAILSVIRRGGEGADGANQGGWGLAGGGLNQGTASEPFPDGSRLPRAEVVNLLRVPGEHQVMLKVRIAELKRSAVRRLGVHAEVQIDDFLASLSTGFGGANGLLSGTFDENSFEILFEALEKNGVAKILAQPTLTVVSGNTATFLAGGEFAVPTIVGIQGAQAAATQFHGFGTQLRFTPTVLDKDRIRINVNPIFSTLNRENMVNGIFGLDTRSASTVVDLREGQVLAIAGLIQEQYRGERNAVPGLGRIPLAGMLFNSKQSTRDETELVVIVSPELVHPMEPEEVPGLMPGDEVTEPGDREFYIKHQIEGAPDVHHRSTVWPTYRYAIRKASKKACKESQDFYLQGPHGFTP